MLAVIAACSAGAAGDDARSGSSAPPASAREPDTLSGGVLISPGGPGLEGAEELARQACQQHDLEAKTAPPLTANGVIRLSYSCQ